MPDRVSALLSLNASIVPFAAARLLAKAGKAVLQTDHPYADGSVKEGHATLRPKPGFPQGQPANLNAQCGVTYADENVWFEVEWRGHAIELVRLSWWPPGANLSQRWFIVASTMKIAEDFFSAVGAYNAQ